jgi:hypothetical protein
MPRSVLILHPRKTAEISCRNLVHKCDLFADNRGLITIPYQLKSDVSIETFNLFISALEDNVVQITNGNFHELSKLSEEFGFSEMLANLSAFRQSPSFRPMCPTDDTEKQSPLIGTSILQEFNWTTQRLARLEREILQLRLAVQRR